GKGGTDGDQYRKTTAPRSRIRGVHRALGERRADYRIGPDEHGEELPRVGSEVPELRRRVLRPRTRLSAIGWVSVRRQWARRSRLRQARGREAPGASVDAQAHDSVRDGGARDRGPGADLRLPRVAPSPDPELQRNERAVRAAP